MKDVFDLIAERNFDQMNQEEHSLVAEVCANEDEFLQMKQVLLQINDINSVKQEPSAKVKSSLDDIFAAQSFPKSAPIWYNRLWVAMYPKEKKMYQRPIIQVAAVLLLIVGILPMVMNTNFENAPSIAKLQKPTQDTLNQKMSPNKKEESRSKQISVDANAAKPPYIQVPESMSTKDLHHNPQMVRALEADHAETFISHDVSAPPVAKALENHPDGVFKGEVTVADKYSIAVSEQPEILDLLTATF